MFFSIQPCESFISWAPSVSLFIFNALTWSIYCISEKNKEWGSREKIIQGLDERKNKYLSQIFNLLEIDCTFRSTWCKALFIPSSGNGLSSAFTSKTLLLQHSLVMHNRHLRQPLKSCGGLFSLAQTEKFQHCLPAVWFLVLRSILGDMVPGLLCWALLPGLCKWQKG